MAASMMRSRALSSLVASGSRSVQRASFSTSRCVGEVSTFKMPALSPTMTEGGIAQWKVAEGDSFSAGDILVEIETDKATMDVEAQDDGIVGKILKPDGSKALPVGTPIAILAEEGDDLSNLSVPEQSDEPAAPKAEEPKAENTKQESAPTTSPSSSPAESHSHKEIKHDMPIAPGVQRLLLSSSLSSSEITALKGTGKNGTLTKGDVLVAMGKIKNPFGSAEAEKMVKEGARGASRFAPPPGERKTAGPAAPATPPPPPSDPASIRKFVMQGLLKASAPKTIPAPTPTFEDIIGSYGLSPKPSLKVLDAIAVPVVKKNEFADLF